MTLVTLFTDPMAAHTSLVGGKGVNLHALTDAGFPVPPGFIVTSTAYDEFLRHVDGLDAELAGFDFEHPDHLHDQCGRLRSRLEAIDLPRTVADAVRAALEQVASSEGEAFAVRSSSTFEDLAQAAFAGQHDTFLNVRGAEAVIRRVRDCFVSLWGDRAVLYRQRQGFSQREARMAVVVQRQITCDVAGVGFSIQPVTGQLKRMVIDANYGLGESVVAGECEVDHFEIDKASREILARSIGDKRHMCIPGETEIREAEVPEDKQREPCLVDGDVQSVAQLLAGVESHYNWPQDIEWGRKDGRLYLFQSRPVTTFEPRWTRDESAERFPNPMSPLTWDFMSEVFKQSLAYSLGLMGLPVIQGEWFASFDNYVYGNQTAVELIASVRPLRARTARELADEITEIRRRYAWVLELPVIWTRDLDRFLIRIGRLSAVSFDNATIPEIWKHINDSLDVAADYFRPNIAISMTHSFLHRTLYALVRMVAGEEASLNVLDGLLAGIETKTAAVNAELHELALIAASSPALGRAFLEQDGRSLWKNHVLDQWPEFAGRFARLLEDHGHREVDMDYREPTWSGQPWVVLDSIALVLRGEGAESPAETARRQRMQFVETELKFLSSLPDDLRFFFREIIRLTRSYTALDDFEHYQTTRINPIARRAAIALGNRLREQHVLDEPEHVFYARKSDLDAFIASNASGGDALGEKVRQARHTYEAAWRRTPAWSLDDDRELIPDAGSLKGLPGSPGQVTGPCFLVRAPSDFGRFPKDAILVARTTNPAWTPLFYSARGLITESGGPLSHGAVTAREMRLPAVMSVRGVMTTLADGQMVTVDGTRGVVTPVEN